MAQPRALYAASPASVGAWLPCMNQILAYHKQTLKLVEQSLYVAEFSGSLLVLHTVANT